jgi:hypothetical protein
MVDSTGQFPNSCFDQPPAMIPPVKLGLLALGLAGWSLELEDDTQGAMGADLIVLPTPVPYECLGFQQGCEDFSVDEFIPQLAVEGLHISVGVWDAIDRHRQG